MRIKKISFYFVHKMEAYAGAIFVPMAVSHIWCLTSSYIYYIIVRLILLAVFIPNESATCNCLIDVFSKWLFKT